MTKQASNQIAEGLQEVLDYLSKITEGSKPLDPEFDKIWQENTEELYEVSPVISRFSVG